MLKSSQPIKRTAITEENSTSFNASIVFLTASDMLLVLEAPRGGDDELLFPSLLSEVVCLGSPVDTFKAKDPGLILPPYIGFINKGPWIAGLKFGSRCRCEDGGSEKADERPSPKIVTARMPPPMTKALRFGNGRFISRKSVKAACHQTSQKGLRFIKGASGAVYIASFVALES